MLLCLVPSRLHLFREPSPSLFPCLDIGQVLALLSLPRVGFKACICLSRPTVNRTRPATTLVPSTHTRRFLLCVAPASLAHVKAVLMAKLTRRAGAVRHELQDSAVDGIKVISLKGLGSPLPSCSSVGRVRLGGDEDDDETGGDDADGNDNEK